MFEIIKASKWGDDKNYQEFLQPKSYNGFAYNYLLTNYQKWTYMAGSEVFAIFIKNSNQNYQKAIFCF